MTLGGNNSYDGVTTINLGALQIEHASALGAVGALKNTVVADGAALRINGTLGTIAAELLTLNGIGGGGGALRNVAGVSTYSGAITLGTSARINADAGTLTLSGGVTTDTGKNVTFGGDGSVSVITQKITGGGGLIKDGAGTLTISILSDFTGDMLVSAGTLALGGANLLPSTALTVDGATAVFDKGAIAETVGTITVRNGGRILGGAGALSSSTLTYNLEDGEVTAILGAGAATVTKTTAGTVTLSGANTFAAGVTLSQGTLNINNGNALGAVAGTFIIEDGTTIDNTTGGLITTLNYPQRWNGDFTFAGTQNLTFGTGGISLGTAFGATRTVTVANNTLTLGGVIADGTSANSLIKGGAGTLLLTGAATYTGSTALQNGTIQIGVANALPTTTVLTLGTAGTTGKLILGTAAATFGQQVAGLQDLNTSSSVVGGYTAASTLTVFNASPNDYTFNGVLGGTSGNEAQLAITKNGSGTLTLGGDNKYAGVTTLTPTTGGKLRVRHNNALGTTAGNTSLGTATTLELDGNSGNLTIAEPIAMVASTLNSLAGDNQLTGAITISGAVVASITADSGSLTLASGSSLTRTTGTITFGGDGDIIVNDSCGGTTGVYIKNGNGTLTLNVPSASSGAITINGGTVVLGDNEIFGVGALTISNGATLDLGGFTESIDGAAAGVTLNDGSIINGTLNNDDRGWVLKNGTISANIGGTGGLTQSTAGTVMLSGNNSGFSGTVTVDDSVGNGILNIRHNNGLGTGNVVVDIGSTLEFQGGIDVPSRTSFTLTGKLRSVSDVNTYRGTISAAAGCTLESVDGTLVLDTAAGDAITGTTIPLTFTGAGNITVNDPVSGTTAPGTLTKTGSGILRLNADRSGAGPTAVNEGTLLVNGTLTTSGAVNVNGGATQGRLGGTGTIPTAVNVADGATLTPGDPEVNGGNGFGVATLTINNTLTLASGSKCNVQLVDQTIGDKVAATAVANLTNVKFYLYETDGDPFTTSGTYTLMTWTGGTDPTESGCTVENIGGVQYTFNVDTTLNKLTVTLSTGAEWDGDLGNGGTDSKWKTAANWVGDARPPLTGGAQIIFDTSHKAATSENDYDNWVTFAGITFDATAGGFTLSGNRITLSGEVVNNSANPQSVNLTGIRLYGGSRTFNAASGNIAVGGAIEDDTATLGIFKTGNETLTLSGDNTYDGITAISAGALNIQHQNALGATGQGTTVDSGAALQIQNSVTTAAEPLTLNGSGESTDGALRNVQDSNTYTGPITLNSPARIQSSAGQLTLNAGTAIANGANTLTFGGAGAIVVNSATASGAGGVIKVDGGTLTLSGANQHTGGTQLDAGTLVINNTAALGAVGSTFVINGGTFDAGSALGTMAINNPETWNGNFTFTGTHSLNMGMGNVGLGGGTRAVTVGANTLTIGGSISNGGITKLGSGTLQLGGANTLTGGIALNQGTLVGTVIGAFGTAGNTVTFGGGELELRAVATAYTAQLNMESSSGTITINPATPLAGVTHTIGTLSIGTRQLSLVPGSLTTADTAYGLTILAAGSTFLTGNPTFDVANNGSGVGTLMLAKLDDGGAARTITKQGAGAVTLSTTATSLAAGSAIVINGGSINHAVANALGVNSPTLSITPTSGTGLYNITAAVGQTLGAITLGGANGTTANITTGTGTLTLGGNVTYDASSNPNMSTISGLLNVGSTQKTFTIGDSSAAPDDVTVSAVLPVAAGGSILKTGPGTLLLSGASTAYTGGFALNQGKIVATVIGALGANTSVVTFGGGELELRAAVTAYTAQLNMGSSSGTITINPATLLPGVPHTTGSLTIGTRQLSLVPGSLTTANTPYGLTILAAGSTFLTGNPTFDVANNGSGGGTLTLAKLDDGGTARTITKQGAGAVTLSTTATSVAAGTAIVINGGSLNHAVASALGVNSPTLSITPTSGTGSYNITAAVGQTLGAITLGGASGTTANIATGTGTLTLGGNVVFDASNNPNMSTISGIVQVGGVQRTFTIGDSTAAADDMTISAVLPVATGGSILKTGSGTLLLSGASTAYTGGFALNQGKIVATVLGALGANTSVVTFGGGELELRAAATAYTAQLNMDSSGGAITINPASSGAGVTHTTGTLSIGTRQLSLVPGTLMTADTAYGLTILAAGSTFMTGNPTFNVANNGTGVGTLTLAKLDDGGTARTITKQGAGAVTLSTTATSVAAGTVIVINGGSLNHAVANALGVNSPTLSITPTSGTGSYNITAAVGQTLGSIMLGGASGTTANIVTGTGTLTLGGNVTYDASNNPNMTTISGLLNVGSSQKTFTIGDSSAAADDVTVSAVLPVATGGSILKTGPGTLLLSGASTAYTGGFALNQGKIVATVAGALGSAASTVTFGSGSLELRAGATTYTALLNMGSSGGTITGNPAAPGPGVAHIIGTLSIGTRTLSFLPGALATSGTQQLTTSGATTLTGNPTFDVSNSGSASGILVLGALGDGGTSRTITKQGDGALTLNTGGVLAAGTAVIINGGTLNQGIANALGGNSPTLAITPTTGTGVYNLTGAAAQTVSGLTLGGAAGTTASITMGTGTLTLGGNVIYDATSNPNGATIAGLLSLGTTQKTFTIGDSSAAADDLTLSATVSSGVGGSLLKDGAGTLVLAAAAGNTYSGGTTVSAGTLQVSNTSNSGTGTGTVTVNGGRLTGNGIMSGALTVNIGGNVAPGLDGAAGGSLHVSGLAGVSLQDGSIGTFEFDTGVNDTIAIDGSGSLTIVSGAKIRIRNESGGNWITAGTYNLIYHNGTYVGIPPLVIDDGDAGSSYEFGNSSGWITVTIGGAVNTWEGGSGSSWQTAANWTGGAPAPFASLNFRGTSSLINDNDFAAGTDFGALSFDAAASGAFTLSGNSIDLNGGVVNNTPDVTQTIGLPLVLIDASREFNTAAGDLTVSGIIGDGGATLGITKTGPGRVLTLTGANDYAGVTTISEGTLQVGNGGGTGQLGTGNTVNNDALVFNRGSGTLTYAKNISGTGSLANNGAGSVTLTGNNSFSGGTTLGGGSGTLVVGSGTALGDVARALALDGGTLNLAIDSGLPAHVTTVGGTATIATDKALPVGGGVNHTLGTLSIGANQLSITIGGNVSGGSPSVTFGLTTLTGAAVFDVASGANLTLGAFAANANPFTKQGLGQLTLNTASGARTAAATSTLSGGTLRLGILGALNTMASPLYLNGGKLSLAVNTTGGTFLGANVVVGQNATLEVDRATLGAPVANSLGTLSIGNQTLNLTAGSNLDPNAAYGVTFTTSTTLTGTPTFNVANNGTGTGSLSLPDIAASANGLIKTGEGKLILAANASTGGVTINQGTVQLKVDTGLGPAPNSTVTFSPASNGTLQLGAANINVSVVGLSGDNTATIENGVDGTATFYVNITSDNSFAGRIRDGAAGLVKLNKQGTGTLTLSGNSTFTGGTVINGGTIVVASTGALGAAGASVTLNDNTGLDLATDTSVNAFNVTGATPGTIFANKATPGSPGISHELGSLTGSGTLTIEAGGNVSGGAPAISFGSASINGTRILNVTSPAALTLGSINYIGTAARVTTFAGSGNASVPGGITQSGSGTFVLSVTTTGSLTLGGAADYTGSTTLAAGSTLNINHATAIGSGAGAFFISGGTLDNTTAGALTLTSNHAQQWNGDFAFTGTQSLNLGTGAVTLGASRVVTVNGGTLTVGGSVSGATFSIAKAGAGALVLNGVVGTTTGGITVGAGTLVLSNVSSYTGATAVNGGTLVGSGSLASSVTVASGATLAAGAAGNAGGALHLTGTTAGLTLANGSFTAFEFDTGVNDTIEIDGTGALAITAGAKVYIHNESGGNWLQSGTYNLIKHNGTYGGNPSVDLSVQGGDPGTTYTFADDGTWINVTIGGSKVWSGLNMTVSDWDAGDNWVGDVAPAAGASLVFTGSARKSDNNNDFLAGTAFAGLTFDSGAADFTLRGNRINLTGNVVNDSADPLGQTLDLPLQLTGGGRTFNTAAGDVTATANAVISDGTASLGITKIGSFTLTVQGANTYEGATTINGGVLRAQNDTALGVAPGGSVSVADGAALVLQHATGLTIGAKALGVTGTGVGGLGALRNVGGANEYGGAITLNGATTIGVDNGSSLTLNSATALSGAHTLTVGGAGNTAISSVIGVSALTKQDGGTLTLNAAANNTYTGATAINGGVLNIRHGGALGVPAGNTTVSSGAALQIQGGITTLAEPLVLNGTGVSSDGALLNISGVNTYAGTVSLGGDGVRINSDADTLIFSAAMTPAAAGYDVTFGGSGNITLGAGTLLNAGDLTKDGSGTLRVQTTALTYTGNTMVSAGTLRLGTANMLPAGALTVDGATAIFDNNGLAETVGAVTLKNGGTITGAGTLIGAGYTVENGLISAVLGNGTPNTLIKNTTDTVVLSAAANNLYAGATTITAGVLNIRHGQSLGTAAGATTVADGAALELQGSITTTVAEPLSLNGTGIGGLGALRNILNNNTFTGPITLQTSSRIGADSVTQLTLSGGVITASGKDLTVGGAGDVNVTTVKITGAGGVTKDGAGTLTMSFTHATGGYAGATALQNGTIQIAAADGLPPTTVLTISGAAGKLILGNGTSNYAQTLAGLETTQAGASVVGGNATTASTLTVNNTSDYVFDGTLGGAGTDGKLSLVKTGAGTLTLSSASSSLAGVTLTAGALGGAGTLNSASTFVANNTGTASASVVLAGAVGLTKSAAGTVTLTGDNTYSGTLAIQAGAVSVQYLADNRNGSGAISLGLTTANGELIYTGSGSTLSRGIALAGSTGDGKITNNGSGNLVFTANPFNSAIAASKLVILGGTGAFGGTIQGVIRNDLGTVGTTVNGGTWVLSHAANSYTGITTINGGVLSAGTLNVGGQPSSIGQAPVAAANLVLGGGTLRYTGGDVTVDRLLTLSASTSSTLEVTEPTTELTLSAALAATLPASATLVKAGTGTLVLGGTAANTAAATLNVNAGELHLNKTAAIDAWRGPLVIGDGTGGANADVVRVLTGDQLLNTGAITINSSGLLVLNGSETIGSLTGASGASVNLGTGTLTVGDANSTTFAGVIAGSGGSLTKQGLGTLTLTGANTYTGDTTVNAGILKLDVGGSLVRTCQVNAGGTLQLAHGSAIADNGQVSLSGATAYVQLDAGVTETVRTLVIDSVVQPAGTYGVGQLNPGGHFTGSGVLTVTASTGAVWYVKPSASGAGDGSTWADACALSHALLNAADGDQIWVAAGTYKPATASDYFTVDAGVELYGGFGGTESTLTDRVDPTANPSTISGDWDNDGWDPDNCDKLVELSGAGAVLDGFTLSQVNGGDMVTLGAASIRSSSTTVRKCRFTQNHGDFGAGFTCYGVYTGVLIENCIFDNHESDGEGNAVAYVRNSSIIVRNCTFHDNRNGPHTNYEGTWMARDATIAVQNSILWDDGGMGASPNEYSQGGLRNWENASTITMDYVTYKPVGDLGWSGTSLLTSDPEFIDPNNADFRLSATSPSRNSANNATAPPTDIRGNSRPKEPTADRGAYEMDAFYDNYVHADPAAGQAATVEGTSETLPHTWTAEGEVVMQAATPQTFGTTRYVFVAWDDDDGADRFTANPYTFTISANRNWTAEFTTQYKHTAATAGGGTATVNGGDEAWVNDGGAISFVAAEEAGYDFARWIINGTEYFTTTVDFDPAEEAYDGTAEFVSEPGLCSVQVQTVPAGRSFTVNGAAFTPNPQAIAHGALLDFLTTTPQDDVNTQYRFSKWNDGLFDSFTLNWDDWEVPGAENVTWTLFFDTYHKLTLTPSAGGTIAPAPDAGDDYYLNNDVVALTAEPESGYAFESWGGDLSGTENPKNVTMGAPKTGSATFKRVYFVKEGVGGSAGLGWADAYSSLATALTAAPAGSEFWVAAGTYTPTDGTTPMVVQSADAIYGGFDGTESARGQRDWAANPTIISGNLDGLDNDSEMVNMPLVAWNLGGAANSATMDGFILEYGNNGSGATYFGGAIGHRVGVQNGAMNVRHCIFRFNTTADTGDGGGAIGHNFGASVIENCLFYGNSSTGGDYGGAIYLRRGTMTLRNCTFADNTTPGNTAADVYASDDDTSSAGFTIKNSILRSGTSAGYFAETPTATAITYSNVKSPSGNYTIANSIDAVPLFVSVAGGNYRLQGASLCIDKATDPGASDGSDLDHTSGAWRPQDGDAGGSSGTEYDMGAYECELDVTPPTVTINQAAGQADPTGVSPIHFTVVFSEWVNDFATGDVTLGGTAPGALVGTVTGGGTTYDVAVSGMTGSGTVTASIAAGKAYDTARIPNPNDAATSTDNTVTYDATPPTVTINQAAGQADPTVSSPIHFTVVFSESVSDFATGDVTLGGTASGTLVGTVTGGGTTYNVAVSGMTGSGTVTASIAAGKAHDAAGNPNDAATSTDNTVTYDATPPTVTINQAAGQADPTVSSPIHFTVVFSESVSDFATGDVTLGGTAPGTLVGTVAGGGTTYNVAVSGITGSGTVMASIAAGKAHDAAGNASDASTSTDNTVTYDATAPTVFIFK